MRTRVVKIGNSQGIRIPKPILEQTGIMEDVELEIEKDRIVIRALCKPREGWDAAFETMSLNNDDVLMAGFGKMSHSWDDEGWEW